MATGTVLDLRRTDLRSNVLENPYWITSGELTKACDDQDAVLFSFPALASVSPGYGTGNIVLLHELFLEVNTVFAGGTLAMNIGNSSLATDAVTTAGTVTDIDPNMYWEDAAGAADIIALGMHTAGASAYLTAKAAATWGTNASILPVDSTVLCIVATITSDGVITGGSARFHALISVVPGV